MSKNVRVVCLVRVPVFVNAIAVAEALEIVEWHIELIILGIAKRHDRFKDRAWDIVRVVLPEHGVAANPRLGVVIC